MTKKQKIWLSVFLAMFIVPEVLWSPVGNFLYSWFMPLKQGSVQLFRNNFLTNTDNINILSLVLGVQFTGLLCALVFLTLKRQQFQNKVAFFVSLSIMVIATIITFFVFGLSMSLRNIGF